MEDELIYECEVPHKTVGKLLFRVRRNFFVLLLLASVAFLIANAVLGLGIANNDGAMSILGVVLVALSAIFIGLSVFLIIRKGGPNRFFPGGKIKVFRNKKKKVIVLEFESFGDSSHKKSIRPNYAVEEMGYLMICENKNSFVFLPLEFEEILKSLID